MDPDIHFDINSRWYYFNEHKLNNILNNEGQSDSNFPLLHLNDRILPNKVDDLKLLLANLNLKFTVIGISETWLQKVAHDVDMIGYEINLFTKIDLIEPVELSNNFDFKVQDDLSGIA